MKKNVRDSYVAPETLPVELVSENIVCTSPITGDRTDYGDPIEQSWVEQIL